MRSCFKFLPPSNSAGSQPYCGHQCHVTGTGDPATSTAAQRKLLTLSDNAAGIRGSSRLCSFGCDQVRDLRRTLQLEMLHLRLQHPVCISDPLVLAQMLEPTIDQKRLDEA